MGNEERILQEVIRQHRCAKEGFRQGYSFEIKQRHILYSERCVLDHLEKDKRKAEYGIKKALRDIAKLQEHIDTLTENVADYIQGISARQEFLRVAATVTEGDV